jgi:hypothetical protein
MKALRRSQVQMKDWVENHRDDGGFLNLFNERLTFDPPPPPPPLSASFIP